jgi:hypothetical protein
MCANTGFIKENGVIAKTSFIFAHADLSLIETKKRPMWQDNQCHPHNSSGALA